MSEFTYAAVLLQKERFAFEILLNDTNSYEIAAEKLFSDNDETSSPRVPEFSKCRTLDSDREDEIFTLEHRSPKLKCVKHIITANDKHLRSEKNCENKKNLNMATDYQTSDYVACYESAEKFLDDKGLVVVEPGAEVRVRKHVKILTNFAPSSDQHLNSPFYEGSPSLTNITGSSLLARRANLRVDSLNQSPLTQDSDTKENTPKSGGLINQRAPPYTHKISRFAKKSQGLQNEQEKEDNVVAQPANDSPKSNKKNALTDWKLMARITDEDPLSDS